MTEFILLNVELDTEEENERRYEERLHLFQVLKNPDAALAYHKRVKEIRDAKENPVKESIAQSVIEWTTMNDYWATFDITVIMDALTEYDKAMGNNAES